MFAFLRTFLLSW